MNKRPDSVIKVQVEVLADISPALHRRLEACPKQARAELIRHLADMGVALREGGASLKIVQGAAGGHPAEVNQPPQRAATKKSVSAAGDLLNQISSGK